MFNISDHQGHDFAAAGDVPSWTLRVQGRLVEPEVDMARLARPIQKKMTSFVKSLVVELDKSMYPDEPIIEVMCLCLGGGEY